MPFQSFLVHRAGSGRHARIQLDVAEGVLVVDQVLLQDGVQRLGLLRAQIDTLEVAHINASFVLLLQRVQAREGEA